MIRKSSTTTGQEPKDKKQKMDSWISTKRNILEAKRLTYLKKGKAVAATSNANEVTVRSAVPLIDAVEKVTISSDALSKMIASRITNTSASTSKKIASRITTTSDATLIKTGQRVMARSAATSIRNRDKFMVRYMNAAAMNNVATGSGATSMKISAGNKVTTRRPGTSIRASVANKVSMKIASRIKTTSAATLIKTGHRVMARSGATSIKNRDKVMARFMNAAAMNNVATGSGATSMKISAGNKVTTRRPGTSIRASVANKVSMKIASRIKTTSAATLIKTGHRVMARSGATSIKNRDKVMARFMNAAAMNNVATGSGATSMKISAGNKVTTRRPGTSIRASVANKVSMKIASRIKTTSAATLIKTGHRVMARSGATSIKNRDKVMARFMNAAAVNKVTTRSPATSRKAAAANKVTTRSPATSTKAVAVNNVSAKIAKLAKPVPVFVCDICTDSTALEESFSLKGCHHKYCKDCVNKYVTSRLGENIAQISCPAPDCRGELEPDHCRSILPQEVFIMWCDKLCEATVTVEGFTKFYCPYKDCSGMLIDDGTQMIKESECPHCRRLFCAQCKVPWHSEVDCEGFQKLHKHERQKEDTMLMNLAKTKFWKRCPSCKMYVERTHGCRYIKCRCGAAFCYGCGTLSIDSTTHYCYHC